MVRIFHDVHIRSIYISIDVAVHAGGLKSNFDVHRACHIPFWQNRSPGCAWCDCNEVAYFRKLLSWWPGLLQFDLLEQVFCISCCTCLLVAYILREFLFFLGFFQCGFLNRIEPSRVSRSAFEFALGIEKLLWTRIWKSSKQVALMHTYGTKKHSGCWKPFLHGFCRNECCYIILVGRNVYCPDGWHSERRSKNMNTNAFPGHTNLIISWIDEHQCTAFQGFFR